MMLRKLLLSILLLTSFSEISAQVANKWVKSHANSNKFTTKSITTDASGNVYIAGEQGNINYTSEIRIVKYDSMGNQVYATNIPPFAGMSPYVTPVKTLADAAGNVYVCGIIGTSMKTNFVARLDPQGNIAWQDTLRGVDPMWYTNYLTDMELDAQGNVIVAGSLQGVGVAGYSHFFVAKISSSGQKLWAERTGVHWSDNDIRKIAVDAAGNIYATGFVLTNGRRMITRKYSPAGNILWEEAYDRDSLVNQVEEGVDVQLDGNGNVYAAGIGDTGGHRDFILRKLSNSGTPLWTTYCSDSVGTGIDELVALYVTQSGNAYLVGNTRAVGSAGDYEILLFKVLPNGLIDWKRKIATPGPASDFIGAMAGKDNPEYVVLTTNKNGTLTNFKIDWNNTLVWEKTQPVSSNPGAGNAVVIAPNHNVYVTGAEGNFAISMRITDADQYMTHTVTNSGSYDFNDTTTKTGVAVDLTGTNMNGDLIVNLLANQIANAIWCQGMPPLMAISKYRFVIKSTLDPSTISARKMRIILAQLDYALIKLLSTNHGMQNPANFSIYQRPLDGQGEFCKVPTTFSNGELSANLTGFSEFFIGSETDTFDYIPTNINDISKNVQLAAYPNPADKSATVMLDLSAPTNVRAVLTDLSGRVVRQVFDGSLGGGAHAIIINTEQLPSGLYLCRIVTAAGRYTSRVSVVH